MAKERNPDRWTEGRVFELLKGPFPDGAFVRIPQVRNGTGFSSKVRTADALVVSCWPSRGLWFAGVEIKVSTADWKRELAKPDKAAEIQQWCDYWYVAAPANVVPIFEVPDNWGLIECLPRGCKIVKPAPKLKSKPADISFVCSVLRAAQQGMVPQCEVQKRAEELAQSARESSDYQTRKLKEDVERFEKETGVSVRSTWEFGEISHAVKLIKQSGARGVKHLAECMKREAERLIKSGREVIEVCDKAIADPEGGKTIGPATADD